MEKTGLIATFNRLLLAEEGFMMERSRTSPAVQLRETRRDLLKCAQAAGQSGDITLMLTAERAFLQTDLDRHANSGAMTTSLKAGLEELKAAEAGLPLVHDPVLYRAVDASHGHPKSRAAGLPKDAPRQFFSSHAARLLNWDKSRLDVEEKALIDQRKLNMRSAEKIYTALQRQALGLGQEAAQGLGR